MKKPVLLVVDVQQDFCPGGQLAVDDGNKIVPKINEYIDFMLKNGGEVVYTQDWHPREHISFAANHKDKEVMETIKTAQGDQVLWPVHCLQRSIGADFHHELKVLGPIFQKGMDKDKEEYSAIQDENSPLLTYLKSRNTTSITVCGIATDYCVRQHVLDLVQFSKGWGVYLANDAIAGVAPDTSKEALEEISSKGVGFIEFNENMLKEVQPV